MKAKIKANLKTGQNPDGLLLETEADYEECLTIKHERLENLLKREEEHWEQNL